ncbi:pectin lyase fold/virulence factor [Xylogone sp. PMI_703]|nr:pectin lyase fold/virulence factor [Xylogone sp. PMI_703]
MRNLQFTSCVTGIMTIWDWGITFQQLHFFSIGVAIDARGGVNSGPNSQPFGSMSILDSTFQSVNIGVFLPGSDPDGKLTQMYLVNVNIVDPPKGTTVVVGTAGGQNILTGGAQTIASWARGTTFLSTHDTGSGSPATAQTLPPPHKPAILLGSDGRFFTRSKPQYQTESAGNFVNVEAFGATGRGISDDSRAINSALQSCASSGKICYFPMGIYLVQNTVFIPSGSRIVGIGYPQIIGAGSRFADETAPVPVVQVEKAGTVGNVEIQDMIFTVQGPTPGAIVLEWNIAAGSQGSAAMWDTHIRIGGAAFSNLQSGACPKLTGSINNGCKAASLAWHITERANGYFENNWIWTSDHDMEMRNSDDWPTWLYGSSVEHFTLYQYQLSAASNVFLGFMQTETPYYQPSLMAPAPWEAAVGKFPNDPDFTLCGGAGDCAKAWALRIINSNDVLVYGAGFYSFFQDYDQTCVNDGSETCQTSLIDISCSDHLWMYDLVSLGAQQAVTPEGGVIVPQINTQFFFVTTVIAYLALSVDGANQDGIGGGSGGPLVFIPPTIWEDPNPAVGCEPPCTLVLPPFPLSTPSVITWPDITTTVLSSTRTAIMTITTTFTVKPFTISSVDVWPVTVVASDTNRATITPVQSVMAPPITITVPGSIALPPVTDTDCAGTSTRPGSGAATSTSSTGCPFITPSASFTTTSHAITIFPQPTVSFSFTDPPRLVAYTTGKPPDPGPCTGIVGVVGCGVVGCAIFGCGGTCGVAACGGGCGTGFCTPITGLPKGDEPGEEDPVCHRIPPPVISISAAGTGSGQPVIGGGGPTGGATVTEGTTHTGGPTTTGGATVTEGTTHTGGGGAPTSTSRVTSTTARGTITRTSSSSFVDVTTTRR